MSTTLRPWKICEGDACSGGRRIEGDIYEIMVRAHASKSGMSGVAAVHGFTKQESQANAVLIVTAVNEREGLLAQVKALKAECEQVDEIRITAENNYRLYQDMKAERDALIAFVESVAGGDCYAYEKTLHPRICGTCETCQARALLARLDGTP